MSDQSWFFPELKRRNVDKIAVADAVAGRLLVEVATQVFPFLENPNLGGCEFAQPAWPAK